MLAEAGFSLPPCAAQVALSRYRAREERHLSRGCELELQDNHEAFVALALARAMICLNCLHDTFCQELRDDL